MRVASTKRNTFRCFRAKVKSISRITSSAIITILVRFWPSLVRHRDSIEIRSQMMNRICTTIICIHIICPWQCCLSSPGINSVVRMSCWPICERITKVCDRRTTFIHSSMFHCPNSLATNFLSFVGAVVTERHLMPVGGYFDVVSAPHMLFEVLMYVFLTVILAGNTSWLWVLIWVVVNQIENAWLSHKWYLETFKDYPKDRRAIIPGLV